LASVLVSGLEVLFLVLVLKCVFLVLKCFEVSVSGGGKGACAPGGTVQWAAFGGAKMWNAEA